MTVIEFFENIYHVEHITYDITNSDKLIMEKKWLNDFSRDLVTVIAHKHK